MTVRLLKSYVLRSGKKMPVGKVLPNRAPWEARKMIRDGIAEEYKGPRLIGRMPRIHKMKTNFFNPKK